jgi:hypothetical protein
VSAPIREIRAAARFIDKTGFLLLMPHKGLPMRTLWEAIRGRPGGHPFRDWDASADLMWEWKDELPKRRLAFYGSIWLGHPGFVSLGMLPCLLRLWGCPLGPDGFRAAYREGTLSFDANRIGEALIRTGPVNTWRLRKRVGLGPASFKRGLVELQKRLVVAKCGSDDSDTKWPAEVVDLSARVFPGAHAEARAMAFLEAREASLEAMASAAPGLSPRLLARLLRTGAPSGEAKGRR